VAISDSHGQIAIPLGILKKTVGTKGYFHQNPANLLKTIAGESISGWIIGWPLPLNKKDKHYRLGETMKIIESLPGVFGHPPPPILLHDERFTTVMARIKAFEEGIIAKTEVDHFAASFILQEYLDFSSRAIFKYDAGEDG
jgi:RNase H-fold protein (predicted Holliday junction resolvase)